MSPITLIRNWRLIVILSSLVALVVFIYLWRGEIIDSAQNAYIAVTNANTIKANEESRKAADNVVREERKITDIDRALCDLSGLVRNNKGCDGQ